MTEQQSRRAGLRQTIEKLLGDETTQIGFAGRGQARRARALALGVERPPDRAAAPQGADFVLLTSARSSNAATMDIPWGIPASPDAAGATGASKPDFVVVPVDGELAALPPSSSARVVRVGTDLPPELVRPLNGLRPEALLVQLGKPESLRDVLRVGMFASVVQAPILAEVGFAPDRSQLELLASLGVNGLVLTGAAASDDAIGKTRAAIDAIDVKELRQRRGSDRDYPVVVPFASRRTEEPDEGDDDDEDEERLR